MALVQMIISKGKNNGAIIGLSGGNFFKVITEEDKYYSAEADYYLNEFYHLPVLTIEMFNFIKDVLEGTMKVKKRKNGRERIFKDENTKSLFFLYYKCVDRYSNYNKQVSVIKKLCSEYKKTSAR